MDLHGDVAGGFRKNELGKRVFQVRVPIPGAAAGAVCVHDQVPRRVVAAGGAHGLHEGPRIVVDAGISGGRHLRVIAVRRSEGRVAPGIVGVQHLVVGLEKKFVPVVPEGLGDLLPERGVTVFRRIELVRHQPGGAVLFFAMVPRVVMDIEDAVHPFVEDVTDDFPDAGHPGGIHAVVRGFQPFVHVPAASIHFQRAHMRVPGDRDPDGVEACFLEHMDERPGGDGLAPAGLIGGRRPVGIGLEPHIGDIPAVGIERVPEIPARAHILHGGSGRFPASRIRRRVRLLRRETVSDGRGRFLVRIEPPDRTRRQGDRVLPAPRQARYDDGQRRARRAGFFDESAPVHRDAGQAGGRAKDVLVESEDNGQGRAFDTARAVRRGDGDQRRAGRLHRFRLHRLSAGEGQEGEGKNNQGILHRYKYNKPFTDQQMQYRTKPILS